VRFAAVDILVNNRGIFEPNLFEQITDNRWRRLFEVKVLSGVRRIFEREFSRRLASAPFCSVS